MTCVRIYRPARSVMQAGIAATEHWLLEYEPLEPRWREPLMGWTASRDMNAQLQLRFPDLAAAIGFADKNGLDYVVTMPQRLRQVRRTYADNFRYDRRIPYTH